MAEKYLRLTLKKVVTEEVVVKVDTELSDLELAQGGYCPIEYNEDWHEFCEAVLADYVFEVDDVEEIKSPSESEREGAYPFTVIRNKS
jgi:hypothetical protein